MKLRIKGNSIRLRLGRSEVDLLMLEGYISESTSFDFLGSQRLEYWLAVDSEAQTMTASFEDNRLEVRVPGDWALSWSSSAEIGLTATQAVAGGRSLRILIEKDLECLDAPVHESQVDAFRRANGTDCGPAEHVAVEPTRSDSEPKPD